MRLADYQEAFAQALLAEDSHGAPPELARLVEQPGFAVYRNTVLKGCIDALHANFPAVSRLVGDEWFRAAAAIYARRELPTAPTLLTYGQTFAEFLARFEPAAELPYLAAVANVDRLWSEAHVAADDVILEAAALAQLAADDMARITLRPHPAARWSWCDAHPIYTLWSRNRDSVADFSAELDWHGEGVLLTRPLGTVIHQDLSRAGVVFLTACADGLSIEGAASAALEADAAVDLAALINQLLQAGALAGMYASAFKDV